MANFSRLKALGTESKTYKSYDGGNANEASRNNMLNNFLAAPLLTLKVDAQVCHQRLIIVLKFETDALIQPLGDDDQEHRRHIGKRCHRQSNGVHDGRRMG
jgi:DUF1365 family protein